MELHPLATRFADVAADYERGRPPYPPAAIGALAAELELERGAPVLDLAAGTGKLTRALLAGGLDVTGIEPLAQMRDVLASHIGAQRAVEGVAEAIPVGDGSQWAVTVADGFHWFDQAAALAEIRRVLVPGGGLAILSTVPDWGGASWSHELGTMISELRPEHPHFDGPPWQEAVAAAGGWGEPREIRVTVSRPSDPEGVVHHLASMSWVAAMADEQRAEVMERINTLIADGETPAEMDVHFVVGLVSLS